jgi:tRNA(Ile)-lysidine synthase TilS/MesJ
MQVVFEIREERSPCSLCAKLRRGILYSKAKELGCSAVALGHHLDDALETYLMNFFFHGRFASFEPKSYLSRTEINLIRPLIYLAEKELVRLVKRFDLPVVFNPCPVDKQTKREEMKQLVNKLTVDYSDLREKFLMGMERKVFTWFKRRE